MHNKTEYWKNRKSGKRGQGDMPDLPKPKFFVDKQGKWVGKKRIQLMIDEVQEIDEWDTGKNMVQSGRGLIMINRKQHRMKQRDKNYDNSTEGKPFTAKGVKPNKQKKPKFELTLDPTLSNKQRYLIRKQRREMILEDQRKERENAKDQEA